MSKEHRLRTESYVAKTMRFVGEQDGVSERELRKLQGTYTAVSQAAQTTVAAGTSLYVMNPQMGNAIIEGVTKGTIQYAEESSGTGTILGKPTINGLVTYGTTHMTREALEGITNIVAQSNPQILTESDGANVASPAVTGLQTPGAVADHPKK